MLFVFVCPIMSISYGEHELREKQTGKNAAELKKML